MAKGYASSFIKEVNASDKSKIGVQLGQICIDKDIPVSDVSDFFNVSRMTIYSWFRGTTNVSEPYLEKAQKLVKKLR
jgi:predicted DNA-binding protein YlxM (UPF0122 family)